MTITGTTWSAVLDPAGVADPDRVELDLNDGIDLMIQQDGIDWGDAAIQQFMADMTIGSAPVDYTIPNRTVTIPIIIGGEGNPDAFAASEQALQQKVARIQAEGGWLLRQRQGADARYADVVNATLTKRDQWGETGSVEQATLVLTCIPDFYADEITLDTISVTGGYVERVLTMGGVTAMISGDHPGRCRVKVTDESGNDQGGLLGGFRCRKYDANALLIEAESLAPVTPASVQTLSGASGGRVLQLNTGSYTAGDPVQLARVTRLPHAGTYRVWARVHLPSTPIGPSSIWLVWGLGDGAAAAANDAGDITSSGFSLVDLGQIRVDANPYGMTSWSGSIFATLDGQTFALDCLYLVPIDECAFRVLPSAPANGQAAVGFDGAWLLNPDGTVHGPAEEVYGDLPRIPVSGMEQRPVQLMLRQARTFPFDPSLTDPMSVEVSYRPSYIFPA